MASMVVVVLMVSCLRQRMGDKEKDKARQHLECDHLVLVNDASHWPLMKTLKLKWSLIETKSIQCLTNFMFGCTFSLIRRCDVQKGF